MKPIKVMIHAAFSIFCLAILTLPAFAQRIVNNVPPGIRQASDLGLMDPMKEINITVQLRIPDDAGFKRMVNDLYDPESPKFHKWLTDADLKEFAPSQEHVDAVRKELQIHGLTILLTDKNGFSIRARGSVGSVESAFHTHIHEFQRNGKIFRANVENAHLSGSVGDYVATVAGIESHEVHPLLSRALNFRTHQPPPTVALSKVEISGGFGSFMTDQILSAPQTFNFTTPGASLPTATYTGNVYGANPSLVPGYTPAQVQALYGLPAVYANGLNGTGQTIVLLEAYGYPTIEADANAFFSLADLPQLTGSNFSIVYPEGQPVNPNDGVLAGWDVEIALDVQWSHTIAPGANIIVVAAAGQDSEDFVDAMNYIVAHNLGYAISDSWKVDLDTLAGPLEEEAFDQVLTMAAAKGISFNFSTGDGGDSGLGTPAGAAGVPSNSPHATAVGGTSIVNRVNWIGYETLGWGTSAVALDQDGIQDPPLAFGLQGGAGGGESIYYAKPSWQASLSGTGRQTPDVSALADPYTGVAIVLTSNGMQGLEPGVGGTSLACPIFTAFWAIANQLAGHSLGQAAPALAVLKSGLPGNPDELWDVMPISSPTNVSGSITDSSGTTTYSATDLFAGMIYGNTGFISAVSNYQDSYYAISFGLDSSLTVTKGWDNVTGNGTPNGMTFLRAVAK
jgi:subtilase family serine protease